MSSLKFSNFKQKIVLGGYHSMIFYILFHTKQSKVSIKPGQPVKCFLLFDSDIMSSYVSIKHTCLKIV